jgi:hypothetical protein
MNIMNNKFKLTSFFIILASLLMLNNSCNDSRLDILPIDILTDYQVFKSEAGTTAYLVSLYNQIPNDGFNFMGWGNNLADFSDEAVGNSFVEQNIPDGTSLGWWGYNNIRNVNYFIQRLPTADISDSKKNTLLSEAKFIRAFYYFGLVKRYGGVPIIKRVQNFTGSNIADLQVPRNTEKEVWDFIATDLDSAIAVLPETSNPGVANKYVALALKCRAMLYAASVAKYGSLMLSGIDGISSSEAAKYWQASYDAAKLIINSNRYFLYNKNTNKELNFTQLFIDTSNPEAIFSEYYHYPDKVHNYHKFYLPFSIRCPLGYGSGIGPYLDLVEQFEYIDGTPGTLKLQNPDGSPIFYAKPTDIFLNKDPRCLASVIVPSATFQGNEIKVQAGIYDQGVKWEAGDPASLYNPTTHKPDMANGTISIVRRDGFGGGADEKSQTGFYIRKYLDYNLPNARSMSADNPWIVFRYGEVLLNYAEAAMELNKTSDAKWAINQIRDRAGIKLLDESEISLDRIKHERLVELAFENHRWWDMRRWRVSDKILNNARFSSLKPYFDIQANAYRFERGIAGRFYKTFDVKVYYERIDPGEIAKNPKLIQNPNY